MLGVEVASNIARPLFRSINTYIWKNRRPIVTRQKRPLSQRNC